MRTVRHRKLSSLRIEGSSPSVSKSPGAINHSPPAASSILVAQRRLVHGSVDLTETLLEGLLMQFIYCFLFKLFERRCAMERPDWDVVYAHPVSNICV
jgi:hypothetical protein